MAGLGNPGPAYEETRHNAGFWFVEAVADRLGLSFRKPLFKNYLLAVKKWENHTLFLLKPLTYMNLSGAAVVPFLAKHQLPNENLLVALDQMDLPPGRARIKPKGSNAGHNGLKSLESCLKSSEFKRLYLGIGRPSNGKIIEHVLGVPDPRDKALIQGQVNQAAESFLKVFSEGWEAAFNEINTRNPD